MFCHNYENVRLFGSFMFVFVLNSKVLLTYVGSPFQYTKWKISKKKISTCPALIHKTCPLFLEFSKPTLSAVNTLKSHFLGTLPTTLKADVLYGCSLIMNSSKKRFEWINLTFRTISFKLVYLCVFRLGTPNNHLWKSLLFISIYSLSTTLLLPQMITL